MQKFSISLPFNGAITLVFLRLKFQLLYIKLLY